MGSIAKSHGMSLDEILALNPEVARSKRTIKGKDWYPLHPEDEISVGEESSSVGSAGAEAFLETETKSEPDWSEEEDEYGYTYADKNKPGYMGQPPIEEDVKVEEDVGADVEDAAPGAMTNWEGEYYEGNYGDPYAKSEEESESDSVVQKYVTDGKSYSDEKKIAGAKDRIAIDIPKFGQWTITETFNAKGPHSKKKPFNYLKNGEIVKHPGGKVNLGLDLINKDNVMKSFLGGTVYDKIESRSGYGNRIIVQTDKFITYKGKKYPLFQQYSHAKDFNIEEGDSISSGQHIGTVGNTGASKGAHLDLRSWVVVPGKGKVEISPQDYFSLIEEKPPVELGGGGSVGKEEPEKKSKNELLRERQRLEAQLRKHGISYKFKKKEKKDLTIDELLDKPFHHGGPVKKYFEGGPSLDPGTGGGQMSDSGLFDEMSAKEVSNWIEANRDTLSPEDNKSMWALVSEKGKEEDPVNFGKAYDRPTTGGDADDWDVNFQSRGQTTYPGEEPGEWSERKDAKEPDRSNVVVSDGVDQDWAPTDKKVGGKFKDKGASTSWEDPKKSPKDTEISPKKTQAELDLERERDEQKKDLAYMDMQKDLIKSQIKAFNDEQEELVKIDPDRFWKGKGTVSTIVAIIGSAAGAYISGRYGGNNKWDEAINKEIDRDIALQKLDRDDQIKKKAAALKRVEMLVKHYEFMTKDKTAQANLRLIEEKIKNERMKVTVKYNKEKLAASDALKMKNGLNDEELAIVNSRYPKENIRKRAVKSTKDGKWYIFNDHDAKKKAMVSVVEGEKAMSSIAELIDLTKKISFGTAVPGFMHGFDKDLTKVKVLRESLKGALRLEIFGPGVMTDTERALAEKIIGDPTKFFTMDSSQIEMLQTLQRKINYGIRQQLIRGGINVPESQNDLVIKQYLRSQGWKPTDENRAKTINALIKLENKHKTGRYWVENENLPL